MTAQRLAVVLTTVNLLLLTLLLLRGESVGAQDVAPVLRARMFELVDGRGTVRASFRVESEPDATVLRLSDETGTIRVKLAADARGSGLVLVDDRTELGVQIGAQPAGSFVRLVNRDGREQVLRP
jgi:hypothetical protein